MRAGDSVDAHHHEDLRIVRWREYDGETVARRVPGMGACCRTSFRESIVKRERSADFRASSLLRRHRHAVENFAHARLVALANQFEIGASQTQR